MDKTLLNKASITTLLLLAIVTWGCFLWLLDIELNWSHAIPFSMTLTVLTSCTVLFDRYLWRTRPIAKFIQRPDINGTWRVTLASTYKCRGAKDPIGSMIAYAVIRQTHSALSIRLMTEQSESFLVASSIEIQEDGTTYISGVYQSDPKIYLRTGVSEIHYGSFRYKVIGSPANKMEGQYWTDRNTNGLIKFEGRKSKFFDSFEDAQVAFGHVAVEG